MFRPGLNEELAATAVAGTQLLGELPGATKQGVTGFWYGKAPGLDRAADAIRHGNLSGTAPLGGAVALIGDDPMAKSSTVPGALRGSLPAPVHAGARAGDDRGDARHSGCTPSRCRGMRALWTALKIVTDLADSSSVATPARRSARSRHSRRASARATGAAGPDQPRRRARPVHGRGSSGHASTRSPLG